MHGLMATSTRVIMLLLRPLSLVRRAASLLALSLLFAGCELLDPGACPADVTRLEVSPGAPTLTVGQSVTLQAIWRGGGCDPDWPATGILYRVRENVGVVAVELTTGRVTALARGTAQIDYYESAERSAPTGSVTVTVQ